LTLAGSAGLRNFLSIESCKYLSGVGCVYTGAQGQKDLLESSNPLYKGHILAKNNLNHRILADFEEAQRKRNYDLGNIDRRRFCVRCQCPVHLCVCKDEPDPVHHQRQHEIPGDGAKIM